MTASGRLQLAGRYLAGTHCLRLEFSLRLAGAELRLRPAPLFWLGAAHRDSQADFARLHRLLRALECPQELLDCQLARSPDSLYQGVAIDLDAARVRGNLFMHCRNQTRLGLGWNGQTLRHTEYRAGLLTDVSDRCWLLSHVHSQYRGVLKALLGEARLSGQGGYWVQREQEQDTELYLTYPWHPPLASLAPSLNAHMLTPLPESWQRYRAAPVRHIGFSCRADPTPAMTLYASAPYANTWPASLAELEEQVMGGTRACLGSFVGHEAPPEGRVARGNLTTACAAGADPNQPWLARSRSCSSRA